MSASDRDLRALASYEMQNDDPPARCKRRARKGEKDGDESRAEWEAWIAGQIPTDAEIEAAVRLAEEVF